MLTKAEHALPSVRQEYTPVAVLLHVSKTTGSTQNTLSFLPWYLLLE